MTSEPRLDLPPLSRDARPHHPEMRVRSEASRTTPAETRGDGVTFADLEPVQITHRADHEYEVRTKKNCAVCNRGKKHPNHRGYSVSMNELGSGNHFAYQNTKKLWQARWRDLLAEADLPHGLGRVLVEGEMCFPDRRDRDQGNLRFFVEKSLGDALQDGGWLEKDTWRHYEFGNLVLRYCKGESWTRLTLFPDWETPAWDSFEVERTNAEIRSGARSDS